MKVIIIGAGPAGLTTAYSILKKDSSCEVIVLEASDMVGGISKTVTYNNNKMDLGGHRFFTKDKEVDALWKKLLKIQGKNSFDDDITGTVKDLYKGGPNPNKKDEVLLIRNRVSRIYYDKKFFDYPISLSFKTIRMMGIKNTFLTFCSYMKSCFVKKDESNLENFYINRFGKKLYSMFFKDYTEKLWGRSPKVIDSSWGSQRVKGLSIKKLIANYFGKVFRVKSKNKETSLIDKFYYPKYGPGQMWEVMSSEVIKMGGKILFNHEVVKIKKKGNVVQEVICKYNGKEVVIKGDCFVSSMPVKDLISNMNNVSKDVKRIANGLPYRDFMTIGLVFDKINLKNKTKIKTVNNILPDCWIYVQEKNVKVGRIQIFNNWSPYLVNDFNNTISIGLEYFCTEGDSLWKLSDDKFKRLALKELKKMEIIDDNCSLLDFHVERVKKAYPAYFDTYSEFDKVKEYLLGFNNLYCIGRNGQHRYNNMDHSMKTGMLTAESILGLNEDKKTIWDVNCEKEYHEEKSDEEESKKNN